jgi:hypothetical protein
MKQYRKTLSVIARSASKARQDEAIYNLQKQKEYL